MPTSPAYDSLVPPSTGETITMVDGRLQVPDHPVIPFIEGDGTGPDIWRASQVAFNGAVRKAYAALKPIAQRTRRLQCHRNIKVTWQTYLFADRQRNHGCNAAASGVDCVPGTRLQSPTAEALLNVPCARTLPMGPLDGGFWRH